MIKIVLMGDLGDPNGYHAGDEAMAEAAIRELAARTDLTVTAVSANPVDTRERYGWDAVPRFGFAEVDPALDRARDARLQAILDGAGGDSGALDRDDPAWKIIQAVADADAVLVTGGGNLNSSWPEHVYERAALTGVAAALSRLLVVSGQTIGPALTRRHGELVGRTVTSARLVAVREAASFEVARALGVLDERLALTVDDATFLEGDRVDSLPARMVAVTFASYTGLLNRSSFLSCAARLLEHTVDVTGLDIVLVPHQGLADETGMRGDVAFHEQIRGAMTRNADRVHLLPVLTARQIAAVTRSAELVLSSRYHPVVFGLGAGVPTLGLAVDEYTSTKIHGALANFGAGAYAFSVAALLDGSLEEAVTDVWARRADISARLAETAAVRATENAIWWDAVVCALGDGVPTPTTLAEVATVTPGPWAEREGALRAWLDVLSRRVRNTELSLAEAQATVETLEASTAELRATVAAVQTQLDAADERRSTASLETEPHPLQRPRMSRYLRVPGELFRRRRP